MKSLYSIPDVPGQGRVARVVPPGAGREGTRELPEDRARRSRRARSCRPRWLRQRESLCSCIRCLGLLPTTFCWWQTSTRTREQPIPRTAACPTATIGSGPWLSSDEQAMYNFQGGGTIDIDGTPQRVPGMSATPSLFRLLRVPPARGRERL